MLQKTKLGEYVKPLTNVYLLSSLIETLENRDIGLPGIGVFHGEPGVGKTHAAMFASAHQDILHIQLTNNYTSKFLFEKILNELGAREKGSTAYLEMRAQESLAQAGRTLVIDEADHALKPRMIDSIRFLHDRSDVPLILIGPYDFPAKLAKFTAIASRVMQRVTAHPASLEDAQSLTGYYGRGIKIAPDLLEHIVTLRRGKVREICTCIAHVRTMARTWNMQTVTLKEWGKEPFPAGNEFLAVGGAL